jgi:DNA-binding IclR family transcriptional regulator
VSEDAVAAGATYQSAERAIALLTSFTDSRVELGVTEMADSIGVHKSTASRLAAVRRDRYATAVAELEEGLVAVAGPVFDGTGGCVAALSISGPAYRMRPDSLGELGRLCAGS